MKPVLDEHEKQTLQHLSNGLTEKEVAVKMNKSVFTIDKYMRSIFEKMEVHSTVCAVAKAIRIGEIT